MKEDVFDSPTVKELFEREGYTSMEFREFMKTGGPIKSRIHETIAYLLTNGKIKLIEKR